MSKLVGSGDALSTERDYVAKVLPAAVLRELRQRHMTSAAAVVTALAFTSAGLPARQAARRDVRCAAARRPVAEPPRRSVTSFVHHRARLTDGQQAAWDRWWPVRGHDVADLAGTTRAAWFGRDAPLILEIGSGMGESTAALAAAEPEVDHLAVEVFEPGIAALLMRAEAAQLTNLAVLRGDAVALLRRAGAGRVARPGSGSSSRTRGPSVATTSAGSCSPPSWRSRPPGCGPAAPCTWPPTGPTTPTQMRAVADAEPLLVGGETAASAVAARDQVRGAGPRRGP